MKNLQEENKMSYRSWKKGKSWLYAASLLALLVGGSLTAQTTKADVVATTTSTVTAVSTNTAPTTVAATSAVASSTTSAVSSTATNSQVSLAATSSASIQSTSIASSSVSAISSSATSVASSSTALQQSAVSSTATSSLTTDVVVTNPDATMNTVTSGIAPAVTAPSKLNPATFDSTTTREFLAAANHVMLIQKGSTPIPHKVGDIYYENGDGTGQAYKIISLVDSYDPAFGYPANGLQAMAASPIVNGVVDTSRIIIAYGATADDTDWLTDFQTVIAGNKNYTAPDGTVMPGQVVTGKQYADSVMAQYPAASVAFTGISLGGYLSQAVAAMEHQPVIAFVGPSAANVLTPEEIAFVQAHPQYYINIRNTWDVILGAYGGNALGDAHYYNEGYLTGIFTNATLEPYFGALTPLVAPLILPVLEFAAFPISGHVPAYLFNPDGSLSAPKVQDFGTLLNVLLPQNFFGPILIPIAQLITNNFATVAAGAQFIYDIAQTVNNVTTAVVSTVTNTTTAVVNTVVGATTAVVNGAVGVVNGVTNTVTSTVTNVVNGVLSLFHW